MTPKIVIITGQTATGKTSYALDLAQKIDGELINADSRQIYKYLNIITGKDLPQSKFVKQKKLHDFTIGFYKYKLNPYPLNPPSYINLWLYDIVDPKQYFSSFDYQTC